MRLGFKQEAGELASLSFPENALAASGGALHKGRRHARYKIAQPKRGRLFGAD